MSKRKKRISRLILNHLRKNPNAGDTLNGITKIWLELEEIDQAVEEVAEVLESLVKKGDVVALRTNGGTLLYKITKNISSH